MDGDTAALLPVLMNEGINVCLNQMWILKEDLDSFTLHFFYYLGDNCKDIYELYKIVPSAWQTLN